VADTEAVIACKSIEFCLFFGPQATHKILKRETVIAVVRFMTIKRYRIRAQYSSFLGRYANTRPVI